MAISSAQRASVDSASKMVGALFPALASVGTALGIASGDLQRVYRNYPGIAIGVMIAFAIAVSLALTAAAMSAEDKPGPVISTLALSVFLFVCAGLILIVMTLLTSVGRDALSVSFKSNDSRSKVTVEVATARLRGRDLVNVKVTAIARSGDCKPQTILEALLGQDKDGNVDYKADLPIEVGSVVVLQAEAIVQRGTETRRSGIAKLSIPHSMAPTTTTTTVAAARAAPTPAQVNPPIGCSP